MKIVIAPDKFKGSLSAMEVCNAIEAGIHQYDPAIETIKHPLADGGEGTLTILQNHFNLKSVSVMVKDPLFRDITTTYKHNENTAFIEMANASGLQLLEESKRNCCHTTTFGTGQLILDAIKKGFKNIVLFIGGSATNDGGVGMATALGYRFYSESGDEIVPIGKELISINSIDSQKLLFDIKDVNVTVVCDVKNPLYGPNGAAYIYGSQKGASAAEIEMLDVGLNHFSKQVSKYLNMDVGEMEGAGAAGGLGAGAVCFLNAKMQSGIDFVMEQTGFNQLLDNTIDLIITGEGSVDKQTIEGKVIKGVSERAIENQIPFSILAGKIEDYNLIKNNLRPHNLMAITSSTITIADAIQNAAIHLQRLSFQLIQNFYNTINNTQ
ncbi:glycerate kinase [Flavobacterium sp. UMI-01]|uniref:glycerate kinase n=1 Tax=Flavobacterium sp. UMI-01 TaxID=1441053 RepID=UPI001C7CD7D2|nr:glycerate kinase [Flavobacterium sp. UMI-01]GIZ07834.1 glycerate kinase [Flavobacterium sp. UMI-01]